MSSPTAAPTAAPTEVILVIPSWVLVLTIITFIFCVCFALMCCRKGEGYKRKIYEMMEEAKLDQEDVYDEEGESDEDEWDDGDTLQTTPTKNKI